MTPKSYLSFLSGFKTIYKEKHSFIEGLALRMDGGLQKLVEAQESVAEMSIELAAKEKELAIANKEAEAVLVEVTAQTKAAEKIKNKVQVVKDKAQAIVDAINKDREIAEGKLEVG